MPLNFAVILLSSEVGETAGGRDAERQVRVHGQRRQQLGERLQRCALVNAVAGSAGPNTGAQDLAVSTDGRRLFALAPCSFQVVSFKIEFDGSLTTLGAGSGLPAGSAGMAAN
jgi:hypothetical protein